jgi:hypothetical protein
MEAEGSAREEERESMEKKKEARLTGESRLDKSLVATFEPS